MTSYLNAGDTIGGRYKIIRPISAGGMGAVYLAEQTSLGREVAIKVILEGVKDKETLDRFELEARAVCLLKHPNIITYHDYGRDDKNNPYIVMEFLPGHPASKLFDADNGATLEVLIHVTSQMCSALAEAHRAGIVHRDLKWTNIMICPQGHDAHFAKLIDFGIVKMPADHAMKKGITQTGMLLGTPQYMPPEAIQGKPVDGRADQYSLGVMLWEGIEGRKPFDADSMFEVFRMHVQDPPPGFTKGKALLDLYPGLEEAIMRAMSKEPAHRFETILHFQQAMHQAMGLSGGPSSIELARTSLPAGTGLTPASRRGRGGTGLQAMDTRLRTGAAKPTGGIPKWAMGAIGLGVALAATAGILVATGGGKGGPPVEVPIAGVQDGLPTQTPEVPIVAVVPNSETVAVVADTADVTAEVDHAADITTAEPDTAIAAVEGPEVTQAGASIATDVAEPIVAAVDPRQVPVQSKGPAHLPRDTTRVTQTARVAPSTRQLLVTVKPWGNVSINGSAEIQAPYAGDLTTGRTYKIVATHPSLGRVEKYVALKPDSDGKPLRVNLSFQE